MYSTATAHGGSAIGHRPSAVDCDQLEIVDVDPAGDMYTGMSARWRPGHLHTPASVSPLAPASGLSQSRNTAKTGPVARTGGIEMYVVPHSPMGRRALWLLLPVLLCLVFPVTLLVPDSRRVVGIAVAIALIGLAVASLVTSGPAIFREKERSVLVVVMACLTFVIVVALALGELLVQH
jgi:hypothetical protein